MPGRIALFSSLPVGRKRILITGCPAGGVVDKLVDSIENNGGAVVCYENC